jgi:sugar-specific transcriptional regulator TrmB
MEENLSDALEEIGFTIGESKVYLSLLRIGESKVGPLINKSQISRSKVYDILERLIVKGVVSKVDKNGVMYYQSLPPNTILNYMKEKEEKIKIETEKLKQVLPNLLSLTKTSTTDVKIYEGNAGFKTLIDKTIEELKKGDSYDVMGLGKTTEFMRLYALKIYQNQKERKFKARSIFDEEGLFKAKERKNSLHEIRILPKDSHTPAFFTLYADTLGIHLGSEESIISIVIKNKSIADSFRVTFETMWKLSRKI